MLIAERRSRILAHVRSQGYASFREIADVVGISESTVRRDLRTMAADGLVTATRGGVGRAGRGGEPVELVERIAEPNDGQDLAAERAAIA